MNESFTFSQLTNGTRQNPNTQNVGPQFRILLLFLCLDCMPIFYLGWAYSVCPIGHVHVMGLSRMFEVPIFSWEATEQASLNRQGSYLWFWILKCIIVHPTMIDRCGIDCIPDRTLPTTSRILTFKLLFYKELYPIIIPDQRISLTTIKFCENIRSKD